MNVYKVPYRGEMISIKELSRKTGVLYVTLWQRIRKKGWSIKRATATLSEKKKPGEGTINAYGEPVFYINGKILKGSRVYAEKILGKKLPKKSVIHHVDGDPARHIGNIVICENQAYHRLLHTRMNALRKSGNPDYRPCKFCHKHDDVNNLVVDCRSHFHRTCRREYDNERYAQKYI